MELALHSTSGAAAGTVTVSDATFAAAFKEPLVHQVVTAYLAGGRAGTKAQKSRSDVRGGGTKPWRQKGTGRARAGSIRSPLWRSGGTTFAARPQSWGQKVNRKMYRGAMRAILSELARQDRLVAVDALDLGEPRTKALLAKLQGLGVGQDVLLIADEPGEALHLAARNLPRVDVAAARMVDPVSLVRFEKVVATADALKRLEERLA